MRIAIIGTGISGLVCTRLLSLRHDVTVFEAASQIGGHANTVKVRLPGQSEEVAVDTGFVVYNQRTYPHFTRILADLDVATQPTEMSFSVRCSRSGLEYNGSSLNGLFAQRSNLCRLSFWRMLRDILRFNREGSQNDESISHNQSVGEFLSERKYSREFAQHYLLPMGAAIWSCPSGDFERFPMQFILQFYRNHGLLSLRDRPVWRVICGGSQQYVNRLAQPFVDRIRLNCPVRSIQRLENDVLIRHALGTERFDEVVFACHSDQALRMLSDPDSQEREILSAFPYSSNTAILHTDTSLLPQRRRAWACWNYHVNDNPEALPTVTYNMNLLQGINSSHTCCVTLNETDSIQPSKILEKFNYSHPLFTTERESYQRRHDSMIRHRRTSYCGAYWRNGFHEDGVVSALNVCRKYGIEQWTAETNRKASIRTQKVSRSPACTSQVAELVNPK